MSAIVHGLYSIWQYLIVMKEHLSPVPHQRPGGALSPAPRSADVPRISVVIPTFNNARFLPLALDSVFAQDFAGVEVIVVDDGSTDGTAAALRPFAAQIRYVWQENAGSAAARNAGLALARGAYVVFLDADDVLLPGKFRLQAAMLDERPSLGMAHSGWQIINDAGEVINTVEPWRAAPVLDVETWLRRKPVKMGAMLFRREWLQRVGGLDPELRQSQDVDLMLRLALAGCTAVWLRQPTMCYRHHANSTIRRHARQQAFYVTRVLDKFFSHPQVPPALRQREPATRYYSALWQAWHLFRSGYLPESVEYLLLSLQYTPYAPRTTVFDWLRHFAKWSAKDGRKVDDVAYMWPFFQQAAPLPPGDWPRMERLLAWWLDEWPWSAQAEGVTVESLWALMGATAAFEHHVPMERLLSWQLRVWSGYVAGAPVEGWAVRFKGMSPAELIDLARASIVLDPDGVSVQMIGRFWRDVLAQGLAPPERAPLAAALYLTYAGQRLMGRHWRESAAGFAQALRQGGGRQVRTAWKQFLQAGFNYLTRRSGAPQQNKYREAVEWRRGKQA